MSALRIRKNNKGVYEGMRKKEKTVCYLRTGVSVFAKTYYGECGRRRGSRFITIIRESVTCEKCKKIIQGRGICDGYKI